MMSIVYKILLNLMIFALVVFTYNGFVAEDGLFSIVFGGLLFSAAMYMVDPVLGFFKMGRNFAGRLIISSLFSLILFALLESVIVGVLIFQATTIGGNFGPLSFPVMDLDGIAISLIFGALYASLFSLIMETLRTSR